MSGAAGWEPASDAEIALYEALAGGDQEGYFQALGRVSLLLPVSADAAAGRSPIGWGTWTANDHTHLLAFTSEQSMRTCLAQHVGGARRMSLRELAAVWPNNDWWLAVNPGLPIEGYLPAWFVAQLARGDARLPGQRPSMPRDRLERVQALERAKAAKAAALPREPIRTVATAGGPLALPPASASPRWARGPSSIVDAEEATTVLPRRTHAKPVVPEPYQQQQPSTPAPVRTSAPPAGQTHTMPLAPVQPSRPLDVPAVPEPYQSPQVPPMPSRTVYGGDAGRYGAPPAPVAPPPTPRPAAPTPQPSAPTQQPAAPAEGRWAGLAEARWEALEEERTGMPRVSPPVPKRDEHPLPKRGEQPTPKRDEQPTQKLERRSLFDDGRPEQPTQRIERRSLFDDGRTEQQTQKIERRSLFKELRPIKPDEQPTQKVERRSLFEESRSAQPDEQLTMKMPRPAAQDQAPAVPEKQPEPRQDREAKPAARAEGPRHAEPEPEFVPANAVEEQLHEAAEAGNTDAFLSTLLLATVFIPKASGTTDGKWRPQPIDGEPHIVSYTSTQHLAEPLETIPIKFVKLISEWPDPNWSFAVNPGTPVGATLPGGQLLALANWAAEVGLGGDDEEDVDEPSVKLNGTPVAGRVSAEVPVLQKAIAPSQVGYYLERGYDRVTGFVHRAHEVGHLKSASQMRAALGLDWEGSPFSVEADEIYLLRWSAHRPSLYRIPYGGQSESAMHAMQGWVIERAPFRGNGFSPGETGEVIAEFKVDSTRLPHGARLMRLKDGAEEMVAVYDADTQKWLRTDGGS